MKKLFEFSSDLLAALDKVARRKGLSREDVVRQALALYFLADEEIAKNKTHRRVAIIEDGEIVSEYSFPDGENDAR